MKTRQPVPRDYQDYCKILETAPWMSWGDFATARKIELASSQQQRFRKRAAEHRKKLRQAQSVAN